MTPPELTEEELLQRTGRGDSRAFDQVYDRMAPRIFGLLRQMMHDGREAEDLLQDGFVLLWEKASTFDPDRGKAFPWVVSLFRNKAIDRMRMLGRRNRLMDSEALEQVALPESVHGSSEDEAASERGLVVGEAFGKVPKEQRRLIELAFLKGLTHHVIAESMGIPLETVRTNIRKGLLRLRDVLKGGA
ncbi:sigma-70 family RNA polymerase sigma factor [Prosthecobacter sp.]|uniref:RNA polymerase sigma factor n=1 Tax=Prosthecobacter sp. TaxID=1965333 RepID=UPI001D44FCEA|nr:sigma-70 family RNA polymerase sigma factor [Prosthecobacter sp.]MCB1277186.1 sigma-70 family RNA polymerase sigma factor [Prosthecobacter sp.]